MKKLSKTMQEKMRRATLRAVGTIGGYSATAQALGITHGPVWRWVNHDGKIPPRRVPEVSRLSGIPQSELRPDLPDLFPAEKEAA